MSGLCVGKCLDIIIEIGAHLKSLSLVTSTFEFLRYFINLERLELGIFEVSVCQDLSVFSWYENLSYLHIYLSSNLDREKRPI